MKNKLILVLVALVLVISAGSFYLLCRDELSSVEDHEQEVTNDESGDEDESTEESGARIMFAPGASEEPDTSGGYSIYIQLDGVNGESREARHTGWTELVGFDQEITHAVADAHGGGGQIRADYGDLVIYKLVDSTTADLFDLVTTGQQLRSVKLDVVGTNSRGELVPYLTYSLTNAFLTTYKVDTDPDYGKPLEELHLDYGTIQWTYTPLEGGSEPYTYGWDVTQNSPL